MLQLSSIFLIYVLKSINLRVIFVFAQNCPSILRTVLGFFLLQSISTSWHLKSPSVLQ